MYSNNVASPRRPVPAAGQIASARCLPRVRYIAIPQARKAMAVFAFIVIKPGTPDIKRMLWTCHPNRTVTAKALVRTEQAIVMSVRLDLCTGLSGSRWVVPSHEFQALRRHRRSAGQEKLRDISVHQPCDSRLPSFLALVVIDNTAILRR